MTQDHTAYPNITRLTLDMVHHNGGTAGRNFAGVPDPEADVKRLLDECLGAEGVYHDDLAAIDAWLGALSAEDFATVTDGEHEECQAILANAPCVSNRGSASDFIDGIFEHCI